MPAPTPPSLPVSDAEVEAVPDGGPSACEPCWAAAFWRSQGSSRSHVEHYLDLLAEHPNGHPGPTPDGERPDLDALEERADRMLVQAGFDETDRGYVVEALRPLLTGVVDTVAAGIANDILAAKREALVAAGPEGKVLVRGYDEAEKIALVYRPDSRAHCADDSRVVREVRALAEEHVEWVASCSDEWERGHAHGWERGRLDFQADLRRILAGDAETTGGDCG